MLEKVLIAALLVLAFAVCAAAIVLVVLVRRHFQRRPTVMYIEELRMRGATMLFSEEERDIVGGLQLLARFGTGPITSVVISRLMVLGQSGDEGTAALARRVLRQHEIDEIERISAK